MEIKLTGSVTLKTKLNSLRNRRDSESLTAAFILLQSFENVNTQDVSLLMQPVNYGRYEFWTQKKFLTLKITKLRGFSPQANYTDRATAATRRS
jgi:hypothetical protein